MALDDQGRRYEALTVLLATGIVDRMPPFEGPSGALEGAIESGAVRLCAVCDGYEASDESIAVYGPVNDAIRHAVFLRTFSRRVSAVRPDDEPPSERMRGLARDAAGRGAAGRARTSPRRGRRLHRRRSRTVGSRRYDTVYPVLGGDAQSQLATGARRARR